MIETVTPEHQVRFDQLRGEPRNADVVCKASHPAGNIGISIEAKADEPFDLLVQDILDRSAKKIADDQNTNAITRVQQRAKALLPARVDDTCALGKLRYQLLTAVAGWLRYAIEVNARCAVFIVHEFVTQETKDEEHKKNQEALNKFVYRLTSGQYSQLSPNQLIGPIIVPGKPSFVNPPSSYIGKAQRDLRFPQ